MALIEGYNLPDELYYHKEHAWAKVEGDKVRVGMNDFYQKLAGDTTYVDLPFEGDAVTQGETCGKIQSSKWVGKFISPVSGEILEVNRDLEDDCTLINKDPYDKGWIILVKPSNLEGDLKNLIHGAAVAEFIKSEKERIEKEKK
ncbi:MAG: glycine cleavage system protein GcvH [Candidatus Edwardsbacteria bacterium]